MPLTKLFLGLKAVNAAIFLVKDCLRRYFSNWTPLTSLFLHLTAAKTAIFRMNVVNITLFLVERRKHNFF